MRSLFVTASIIGILALSPSWAKANDASDHPLVSQNTPQPPTAAMRPRANQHDDRFIEQGAIAGQAAVQFGELAAQKAVDPAVQEFGRWMAADFGMANETFEAVASHEGMTVSKNLDAAHQEEYGKLQQLSGTDFDRAYIQSQLQARETAVALYADEFRAGENRTLKALAQHMLPALRTHLEEAQILAGYVSASHGAAGSEMSGSATAPEAGK